MLFTRNISSGDDPHWKALMDISLFFPVYNDENTVELVTEKAIAFCEKHADRYEVIIINDGSPDQSGARADALAEKYSHLKVIHHERNLGYGAAIQTGLKACQYEWICFTDGDDEYDIGDFAKLIRLREFYDLIITFRYVRMYSNFRILCSVVYNTILRSLFDTHFRDISTGLRMIRKELVDELELTATSPFIGAEITIKTMLKGFRIGEVGIQTFPRRFGKGASVTIPNILSTIKEMWQMYRHIFSVNYDLPQGRERRDPRN